MRLDTAVWTRPLPLPRFRPATAGSESFPSLVEVLVALLGVIALLPLLALIALAVRLSSRGPVLYRGARVGKDGRIITIYKFRTMRVGAEETIGARLFFDEPVVTPVGGVLRYTKADELPQLVNVMRGEMRLVGPRPVRPVFLRQFTAEIPRYTERFSVAPGITGLAQLRGGYYTSARDKLRYDRLYIRRRSMALDVKIIVLTLLNLAVRIASGGAGRPRRGRGRLRGGLPAGTGPMLAGAGIDGPRGGLRAPLP